MWHYFLAAGLGFEPRYSPPKGDVLPLDDPAILLFDSVASGLLELCEQARILSLPEVNNLTNFSPFY